MSELCDLTGHTEYTTQKYLKIIKSPQLRNIYSWVQTNSSKLSPNPYSEISENCEKCGVLRNFKHVLLHCSDYINEREKFFTQLRSTDCNINPSADNFYTTIMSLDFKDLSKESINCVTPIIRTCWIYNLCGSIRIYKNQIHGIDPRYGSIKISIDLYRST